MIRRMVPNRLFCLIGKHRWVYKGDEFWIASIFKCKDCGRKYTKFNDV